MPRGNLRVRGEVTNAKKLGANLARGRRVLDDILREALADSSEAAVSILRAEAPKGRTKQLSRGIKARRRGNTRIDITVHAVNRETGYDYAAVTRFGHRVAEIWPTEGRQALRLRLRGGQIKYARYVKGVKVSRDWVDTAMPAIDVEVDEVMRKVGREVELRVFS